MSSRVSDHESVLIQIAMYLFYATFLTNAHTCSNILYMQFIYKWLSSCNKPRSGCPFCPYSLYLLGVIQQAVPKQQQQTMMTGTDTRITNRISNAIPTTAPGVRPANRKHARVDNALPKRLNIFDCMMRRIRSLLYVKHSADSGRHTKADSGRHTKADSGTHTKADSSTHTKADSGRHTKADSGTHTKADSDTHTEADSGTHTKADSGTHTEADSGTHTKAYSNTHTKADSGTHTKADSGTHTKADSGTHTHTYVVQLNMDIIRKINRNRVSTGTWTRMTHC